MHLGVHTVNDARRATRSHVRGDDKFARLLIWVPDVSVAVKWFAPDGDEEDAQAEAVLRRVAAQPRHFAVPELFFHELLAVLCRRLRQARDVAAAIDRATRLGMRRVRLDARLVQRAARVAFDHKLTGYDACYVALAWELDGKWLTFDEAAHRRIESMGCSALPDLLT